MANTAYYELESGQAGIDIQSPVSQLRNNYIILADDLNDGSSPTLQWGEQRSNHAMMPEDRYSYGAKLLLLAAYFFLNLTMTISNKALLGKASFPWLLTAMHASATSFGCFAMMGSGFLKVRRLAGRETMVLIAFSFLFTLNIAVSNLSLAAVSLPLHQILRSTCPVFTIGIYRMFYRRSYPRLTYISMIPLIAGVGLATAGDYFCTIVGFLLTMTGVVLAAIKTVATNRLVSNLAPLEVVLFMSPLAATQCVAYAYLSGEVYAVRVAIHAGTYASMDRRFVLALLLNACIAFALNIISFQTNKVAGALTISVCGNVKQALAILMGIVLFGVPVGLLNISGMLVTVAGAAWFSKVEMDAKSSSDRS